MLNPGRTLFHQSGDAHPVRLLALELAGRRNVEAPRPQIEDLLTDSTQASMAHFSLACRQPRRLYDYAQQCSDLPAALQLRVAALTGYLDGIIAACADMADSDGPISPMQADLLLLTLGNYADDVMPTRSPLCIRFHGRVHCLDHLLTV